MIFQIVQYSVVSLVFISIVHYLISHLTDNLTTPQVRDIVASTNEQYEAIIKRLEKDRSNRRPNLAPDDMKSDLKTYLKSLNSQPGQATPRYDSGEELKMRMSGDAESHLMTYDSSDNVFGSYDGDAYTSY